MSACQVKEITAAIAALLLSVSPAFTVDNVLVRHIDTLLDFVGFVTAHCVQHYEEETQTGSGGKAALLRNRDSSVLCMLDQASCQ